MRCIMNVSICYMSESWTSCYKSESWIGTTSVLETLSMTLKDSGKRKYSSNDYCYRQWPGFLLSMEREWLKVRIYVNSKGVPKTLLVAQEMQEQTWKIQEGWYGRWPWKWSVAIDFSSVCIKSNKKEMIKCNKNQDSLLLYKLKCYNKALVIW